MIEALRAIDITDIACGGAHSAAISSYGHLYTWGKGRYGRLGHGDSEDQLKPKRVTTMYTRSLLKYIKHIQAFSAQE